MQADRMGQIILSIEENSLACDMGLYPGDVILSINAQSVLDCIDYQALCAGEDITLIIQRGEEVFEVSADKDEDEGLGVSFESDLMSPMKTCHNHCLFCFVDQLPKGVRASMLEKDDDWRMSLMMGNYVTLSNVSDHELERIILRKASPLYISVHAMDGDIRARMLGNKNAHNIKVQLKKLAHAGLSFHAQIVLCPDINDGDVLEETIFALADLHPATRSIAIVPVGLTGHRENLVPLRAFKKQEAVNLLYTVASWQKIFRKALGTSLVFASDELYCQANLPLPSYNAYENFPQIENGVGLLRTLEYEVLDALEELDVKTVRSRHVIIATGVSAAPFLQELFETHPLQGIRIEVRALINHFFGPSVTVAGLLTGGDLKAQLADANCDEVLITRSMLRAGEDVFLDDMTLGQLQAALPCPIRAVGGDGYELVLALAGQPQEGDNNDG